MAAGGHFGCPKIFSITVLAISAIRNFFFLTKTMKFFDKDNVSYRTRPRYLDE